MAGPFEPSSPEEAAAGEALDRRDIDVLFTACYQELRRLAVALKRDDPSITLTPTALVNEAWMKLVKSPGFVATSPLHFKRIAARAMRQVLVEGARRRIAKKRGGIDITIALDATSDATVSSSEQLLALDAALQVLARLSPRQAAVVEHRFFGGLEETEIATLLGVSEITVSRDWRAARAWLAVQLRRE